jgi:hypothetical protein
VARQPVRCFATSEGGVGHAQRDADFR